jgi:hypothetical protein
MRAALSDPDLFGRVFAGESWAAWRVLLIAAMGEVLTQAERMVFEMLTGRPREPAERVDELWAVIGRRGGKTRAVAILAAFIAALCDHTDVLAPGERAVLPILSASVWQAQKAFGFLAGIFDAVPALSQMVIGRTAETIALSNGVDIECRPASYRTIRGVTAVAIVADEVAFWRTENSLNPDKEILDAARPSLATTGGPLIVISSPYGKRGELWNAFRRDFGPEGDPLILIARAPSWAVNPTLPMRVVERAYERDPMAARAEYDAEFRTDVAAFLDLAIVEAAVDHGVTVRPLVRGVRYRSGCDPSGGARDSFTLAIAHDEDGVAILDCLYEIKPPFNPTAAVADMAGVLKGYGLTRTVGDKYAAEWVVDAFAKAGIRYQHSDRDRSAIYLDVLPKFTSGRVRILDNSRLVTQFAALERRTSQIGKDRVDHGPGGHDDLCNSAALALVAKGRAPLIFSRELLDRIDASGSRRHSTWPPFDEAGSRTGRSGPRNQAACS